MTNIVGAKTECFSITVLDNILNLLRSIHITSHYDPFIYVDDKAVCDILGVNCDDYCIRKNFTTPSKKVKVRKALRNLAANVIVNNKTFIYYHEGLMVLLSLESGVTYEVFKDFIPPNSYVDFEIHGEYEIKFRGMVLADKALNYKKVRPDYLSKIFSIASANNLKGQAKMYQRKVREYIYEILGSDNNCKLETK